MSNLSTALEIKIYTLLGFAQKAGKLISGDDSVFAALKHKQPELLIIAEDLSDNSKEKVDQKLYSAEKAKRLETGSIKTYTFGNKASLGHAIGKSPRGLIAVIDKNFAQAITKYLQELA